MPSLTLLIIFIPIILGLIVGNSDIGSFYNRVDEGHVGVYFQGGAMMPGIVQPGFHTVIPFITQLKQIPVGMQTIKVEDVPCGTNGGVVLHFNSVEVVYRLNPAYVWNTVKEYSIDFATTWIHDPVHHEVNQLCSAMSLHEVFISKFSELDEMLHEKLSEVHKQYLPGVEIITIRFSKPVIPDLVRNSFMEVAKQTSLLKTVIEQEANILRSAEKDKTLAVMEANKLKELSIMSSEAALSKLKQQVSIEAINTETFIARIKEHANAAYYGKMKEAEANSLRLTPSFLDLQRKIHILRNIEMYWGNQIPDSIILDNKDDDGGGVDTSLLKKLS